MRPGGQGTQASGRTVLSPQTRDANLVGDVERVQRSLAWAWVINHVALGLGIFLTIILTIVFITPLLRLRGVPVGAVSPPHGGWTLPIKTTAGPRHVLQSG